MSLLKGITHGESPEVAKCLAHLIAVVKCLGWESLMDTNEIKPNIRRAQLYIRKNAEEFTKIFKMSFHNVPKNEVVDTINPFLIDMWHIQIVGGTDRASLQLLRKINYVNRACDIFN